MQVFKFGGASVNSIERIQQAGKIIQSYKGQELLIVVSAMGKTTNALEKVAEAFYSGNKEEALQLFDAIKQNHLNTAKYLLVTTFNKTLEQLSDFFTEVEWLLHDKPVREYDYYYDQVVCIGELLSTVIVSAYLNETGFTNQWIDVRDIIRTDDNFRNAGIDWQYTGEQVEAMIQPILAQQKAIVTQGFIGSTDECESTTLGREGSDYTAAVFANLLNAEAQVIWKDVEGVMNADPKLFPDAQLLRELNYDEVIEMAYYGAQVIHPKTIKPLQNKGIPLYVKCFLDASLQGTVIHNKTIKGLPPIIVLKQNQVLIRLHSRDFSFVGETAVANLYQLLADSKIQPNLMQTGAVTIQAVFDNQTDKIEKLAIAATNIFDVQIEKGLTLLTIRHYDNDILQKMIAGNKVELLQQTPETVQVVMMS